MPEARTPEVTPHHTCLVYFRSVFAKSTKKKNTLKKVLTSVLKISKCSF